MRGARSLLRGGWPLLLLALVVRVAQIAATHHWVPVSDPADYVRNALSIAQGHGMAQSLVGDHGPSALRAPAFPYSLGAVFVVSGDSFTAGRVASALLGVVTVGLIGLLADMLWTRRVALVAMGIAAVYPPLVLLSGTLLTESLALPLALLMLVFVLERRVVPAGVVFGLALLARPAFLPFAIPLVAGLWDARRWRAPLVAVAVAVVVVVPWTIRNAVEFHAFVPISSESGFLVAGTYNPTSAHDPVEPATYRPVTFDPGLRRIATDGALDEHQVDVQLTRAGRDYARHHTGYVAKVLWFNGLRLLGLKNSAAEAKFTYAFQGIGAGWAKLARFAWYLLALLAIAGLARGAARTQPWWLWATPVVLCLSVIWISGDLRYRVPIEPFAIWLAAYALTGRRRAQPPPPTTPPPR